MSVRFRKKHTGKQKPIEISKLELFLLQEITCDINEAHDLITRAVWTPDSPFTTPEARRECWQEHRHQIIDTLSGPGVGLDPMLIGAVIEYGE